MYKIYRQFPPKLEQIMLRPMEEQSIPKNMKVLLHSLWLLLPGVMQAATVIETLTGMGSLQSPGDSGDHTSETYEQPFTFSSGLATISFNVSVSVGSGPVHFDINGFGDSAGSRDSLDQNETMRFQISDLVVSTSSGSVVSHTIEINFESFELFNASGQATTVGWSDNAGGSGSISVGSNGNGNSIVENGIAANATVIDIVGQGSGNNRGAFINNAIFTYSGNVEIETIPELGLSVFLPFGICFVFCSRRKRDLSSL